MKKITALAAISAAVLCACGTGSAPAADTKSSAPVSERSGSGQAASESGSVQETEASAESLTEEPLSTETEAPAAPLTAGELVSVEKIETDYAVLNYPVFNAEKLDADDAKAANLLFEYIKNLLLEEAAEYKEFSCIASPEELAEYRIPASETYVSIYDGILSVLMSYEYTFGLLGTYYTSVSFDISGGKAVGAEKLISAAGLTDNDVKNSVLWCTKAYLLNSRDERYISECRDTGELPRFTSHDGLFNDEKVLCEIAMDNYDNGVEYFIPGKEGMPWEGLPLERTAFIDEDGQLYVFGTTAPGGQIPGKMVAAARSDEETADAELHSRFGAMRRMSYIMPEDVPQILDGVVDPEEMPDYRIRSVDQVYASGEYFYVYVTDVFSCTGSAPALTARYAVSLFDERIWEMDDNGEWAMIE